MNSIKLDRYKLGGKLLAFGASLALLLKTYWLINMIQGPADNTYPMKVSFESSVIFLIGDWQHLIWIPWGAVFILFLLWKAIKIIRNQDPGYLGPMYFIGFWLFGAQIYTYISFGYFGFSDIANLTMISGLVLIGLFSEHGELKMKLKGECIAPFKIKSERGGYYLIKLQDSKDASKYLTIFIHGGKSIKLKIPLGSYIFKYAYGKKWYGYKHYFGKKTLYSKANETFDFKLMNNQAIGYTITLYTVPGGNLQTHNINPEEF